MALPMINCQSFIISQEKILIYFKIVLLIQSQHGLKKLHPAATPSSPLTTASQTDHRNTRKNKKMRPVPQKTGCVHIRGKIPLIVMHMLVVT